MKIKDVAVAVGVAGMLLSVLNCGSGGDDCVAAKRHMCDKIPGQNCYAAFMDNAQNKIIAACGQAELNAYIPVVQAACSASPAAMNCGAIAGKTYAGTVPDGAGKCDAGAPMPFAYSGTATADGRTASLSFTISGNDVLAGKLSANSVCASGFHLNRTEIDFTGRTSGPWESAAGTITAQWTGGDSTCEGTRLTPANGYPNDGSLTIWLAGNKVMLKRIADGLPYEFPAINQTYSPPAATCGTPTAAP